MATQQYNNYANLITFTRASTGTYVGSDSLVQTAATNVPRTEYDANGAVLGLLIEEARTNLYSYSADFSNSAWGKTLTTVAADVTTSPDGTGNADKLQETTTTTSFFALNRNPAASTSTGYVWSCYFKAAERTFVGINFSAVGVTASFDLITGVCQTNSVADAVSMVSVGDGWWRCSLRFTTPASGTNLLYHIISIGQSLGTPITTGIAGYGFYLWGAQLEVGSFLTSYIPTTTATATRASDIASIATSAFGYNTTAGTVVCEFDMQYAPTGFPRIWELGATSTGDDRITLFVAASGSTIYGNAYVNNVSTNLLTLATDPTPAAGKAAYAFAENSFAGIMGTGTLQTSSSGTIVPAVPRNILKLGGASNSSVSLITGHLKSLQYYPYRLLNSQIQGLTA